MPYCPNCGHRVESAHHYCGSCGQSLSDVGDSEEDPASTASRDGFLSARSVAYVTDLHEGERPLDRDSTSYAQLADEVTAAFADFALLSLVTDLELLPLWAAGIDGKALSQSPENMNNTEVEDNLAALGLQRTLRLYDDAFSTTFEDEVPDRLEVMTEVATEEMDDHSSK